MRKIYLLFSLCFIFIGCEKDEINQPLEEEQLHQEAISPRLKEISFKKLPERLNEIFDSKNLIKTKNGKSSDYFGSVNLKKPVQEIIAEDGNSSFTFLLNKNKNTDDRPLYFDNLVVFENGKKEETSYVVRYEPALEWYKNSKDFNDFTGNIIFYTIEGKAFNSLYLEKGKPLVPNQKSGCTIELKDVVTVCTDGGSIGGQGSSIDETCVTTYNYEVNCMSGGSGSPSSGDDDGGPNGPGPGSGGDGSNDGPGSDGDGLTDFEPVEGWTPPTIPDEEDPCAQMITLEDDDSFRERMENLADKTDLDYETGYLLSIDGDEYSYTEINGEPDSLSIDFDVDGQIDGLMHTHYNNSEALPTFSATDIRAIYNLFQNNSISNLSSFTSSVVTADDTSYSLKIDSKGDFLNFASANLNTQSDFRSFEIDYNNAFNYYSNWYGETEAREKALLKILEDSGLILFKGNNNFDDWQAIQLDSSSMNIINDNCN